MKFAAEVVGDKKTGHLLQQLGHRAADPRPVFKEIADLFQRGQARQFSSGGAYFGTPWAPLAESTVARTGAHRPLHLTGALERAVAGKGKGKLRRVTKTKVTVGTSLFYAIFHQGGTSKGVPARPVVGISRRDGKQALTMLERHLTG